MAVTNKGWNYISAIFMTMLNKTNEDEIIEPQYIYRGIAKNYISRSPSIEKCLNEKNKISKDSTVEDIRKETVIMFDNTNTNVKGFWKGLLEKNSCLGIDSCISAIQDLMDNKEYPLICPEFIKSGLAVRLQDGAISKTPHIDYLNYIKHMLNDVKERFPKYVDENYTDLEILADLQHKGAASCLVDFSNNFLISLYFATNTDFQDFGYLFCYDINKAVIEGNRLTILDPQRYDQKNIIELLNETAKATKYSGKQDYKFWLWRPSNLNERIARQDSVFVFGLEAFDVNEHNIITIPIPPGWKQDIQHTLKHYFGITKESVYCDIDGYADANSKLSPYEKNVVHFFNEDFDVKMNQTESEKKDYHEAFGYFQNAMSCLFQCEYELALKYFTQYETRMEPIPDSVNKIVLNGIVDYYMLRVLTIGLELHFSKAICLKHLKDPYGAIKEFKEVEGLYKLFEEVKNQRNNGNETKEHFEKYKKYYNAKYQKAINDLTDLYYDTMQYDEIVKAVDSIKVDYNDEHAEEEKEKLAKNVEALKRTIKNEVECLKYLSNCIKINSINYNGVNRIDRERYPEFGGQPFFLALNLFFYTVVRLIAAEDVNTIQNAFNDEIDKIKKEGKFPKGFYSSWDLSDIKKKIRMFKSKDGQKYMELMTLISKMEDFMNYVQGKIKIKPW